MAKQSIKRNRKTNRRDRSAKNRDVHLQADHPEKPSEDVMEQEDAVNVYSSDEYDDSQEENELNEYITPDNQDPLVDPISSFSEEEKEDMFAQLESQIENKKKLLMSKRKYLNKYETENPYLTEVKQQYEEIYNALLNEKRKEFIALNALQEYLLYLINNNIVIDKELVSVRKEQQRVLEEMQRLRAQVHYAW